MAQMAKFVPSHVQETLRFMDDAYVYACGSADAILLLRDWARRGWLSEPRVQSSHSAGHFAICYNPACYFGYEAPLDTALAAIKERASALLATALEDSLSLPKEVSNLIAEYTDPRSRQFYKQAVLDEQAKFVFSFVHGPSLQYASHYIRSFNPGAWRGPYDGFKENMF